MIEFDEYRKPTITDELSQGMWLFYGNDDCPVCISAYAREIVGRGNDARVEFSKSQLTTREPSVDFGVFNYKNGVPESGSVPMSNEHLGLLGDSNLPDFAKKAVGIEVEE